MKAHTDSFTVSTRGKGTYEITDAVAQIVRASGVRTGTATVFIQHTSASLIITKMPTAQRARICTRSSSALCRRIRIYFVHTAEGPDDMPSHLRMVLTRTSEVIPVAGGAMQLGTWQDLPLRTSISSAHPLLVVSVRRRLVALRRKLTRVPTAYT
jgi:secondary thiamine-phosphate synthase enzyme